MPLGSDGTGYSVLARADGNYEVVMIKAEGMPEVVKIFATEAEAEHWVLEQIGSKPNDGLPPVATIP